MAAPAPAVGSVWKQQPSQNSPRTITDAEKAQAETARKNLNIALHHAYRIQAQKDAESQILASITFLLDFPSTATGAASHDASAIFLQHIQPFQPSDLDSLTEERRIDNKCGYSLCLNRPRIASMGRSVAWKLAKGMGDYCSDSCARKNLFLRAQLSETPAWERHAPDHQPDLVLHEHARPAEDDTASARAASRAKKIEGGRRKVADQEQLASERGEKPASFRPKQLVMERIVERTVEIKKDAMLPRAPDEDELERIAGEIEGFTPQAFAREGKEKGKVDDAGDAGDDDDDD